MTSLQQKVRTNDAIPAEAGIPVIHPKMDVLRDMLAAGVHIGHRTSNWCPKMAPFIHGVKGTVHVFNLERTLEKLEEAETFVSEIAGEGGVVLFVGTKPSAKDIVKNAAVRCGMPYVCVRWLGGTLTNFKTLSERIKYFKDLEAKKASGELEKYPKKEQVLFNRELLELEEKFGGTKNLVTLPQALFVVDILAEETAVREARRMHIPTVAVVDTNADPTAVTHPIPANDDALSAIAYVANRIADAIQKARAARAVKKLSEESTEE